MEENDENRIVFVGDGYTGKTSIVKALLKNKFEEASDPNIISFKKFTYNNLTLNLVDTAGQEEYDDIRRAAYEKVSLFIICYAIDDENSYENIKSKWIRDLDLHKDTPRILIGTKVDLRKLKPKTLTYNQGVQLKKKIKALHFLECSAKTTEGIDKIMETVQQIFDKKASKSSCVLQ